jgi:hypothetical protein
MHVFVTRGGEPAALVGPICDNETCTDCAGWVGLESGHRVDVVTVADRPDITGADLEVRHRVTPISCRASRSARRA